MTKIGCDPAQVEALGDRFTAASKAIDGTVEGVSRMLSGLPWYGDDADWLQQTWRQQTEPVFDSIADRMRKMSAGLRKQAADQREVSKTLISLGAPGGTETVGDGQCLTNEAERQLLEELLSKSPVEQRRFWDRLTDDERRRLLKEYPDLILQMRGLPDAVYAAARTSFARNQDLEISQSDASLVIQGNVLWVDFGVEGGGSIKRTSDPDFPYEVELYLEGKVGAGIGENGAVGITGGVHQTYEFKTKAEAEAFLKELKDAIIPSVGEGIWEFPQFLDGGVGGDIVKDTLDYLGDHKDNLSTSVANLGVYGGLKLDLAGAEVEIEGSGGFTRDLKNGTNGAYVDLHLEGELELGELELSGQTDVAMKFELDKNNSPSSLEIELSGDFGGEFLDMEGGGAIESKGVDVGVLEVDSETRSGVEGRTKLEIDMTEPHNQELARTLIESGPTSAAGRQALQSLYNSATVTVQSGVFVENTTTGELDFKAASVEIEGKTSEHQTTGSWVKPPGGSFYSISNKELSGGK